MVLRCAKGPLPFPTFYLLKIFFLFCRANDTKISIVKEILHIYGLASGQLINHEKLEIFSAPILPNTRGATSQPSL